MVHNDYTHEVPPVVEIYSDRLTITSYGGLVHGLSRGEFFKGRSMIRNREIMRVYRDLDLVEQLGSGMNRILQAYPKDIFHFSENFMEVGIAFEEGYLESLEKGKKVLEKIQRNGQELEIKGQNEFLSGQRDPLNDLLSLLKSHPTANYQALAQFMAVSEATIKRHIQKLKQQAKLKRVGSKKTGHWEIIDE